MTLSIVVTAGLAGFIAGCLSFAFLWWTVQATPRFRYPIALFVISSALRSVAVAAVIVVAGRGQLVATLVAVIGMLAARVLLTARLGRGGGSGRGGLDDDV